MGGGNKVAQTISPYSGYQFCTLKIRVTNDGAENDLFSLNDQIIVYEDEDYKVNSQATTAIGQNMMPILTAGSENMPAVPSVINMVFQLPESEDNPNLENGVAKVILKAKNNDQEASFTINPEKK